MNKKQIDDFKHFLELPEEERFELLTSYKLYWYQKIYIRMLNKWWSSMKKNNLNIEPMILFNGIYKARF